MNIKQFLEGRKPILINFSSTGSKLISDEYIDSNPSLLMTNFSNLESTEESKLAVNFSIQIYIRDRSQPARTVIARRIREVARYINSTDDKKLKTTAQFAIDYLRVYLNNILFKWLTDLQDGKYTNLLLALGIQPYIKNKSSTTKLNMVLRRLAKELETKGFMSKVIQDKVQEAYSEVIKDFFQTIEDRYIPKPEKKGWLTGEKLQEEEDESKTTGNPSDITEESESKVTTEQTISK